MYYQHSGEDAFTDSIKTRKYSNELKETIVREYLSGACSAKILGSRHDIDGATIINWVQKYYHGKEQTPKDQKGDCVAMKTKKTTFEERMKIVLWVIDNDMNSKEASKKYNISYTTIRNWVSKYQNEGAEGLVHKPRGRKTTTVDEGSLSEIEKLKLELERERELRKKREFEIEVLKKKEEFEMKNRYRK